MSENGTNGGIGDIDDMEDIGEDPKTSLIGEITRPAQMAALPEFLEFAATIERQEGFGEERIKRSKRPFGRPSSLSSAMREGDG